MDSDLISRSDLLTRMCQENCGERQCVDAMDRCVWYYYIKQQPTVDAAPVVQGEWKRTDITTDDGWALYRCSCCDWHTTYYYSHYASPDYNYCPNCGADMRGNCNE